MTHLCLTGAGAAAGDISSPLGLSPTLWLRPDSGVYTGGSRTLTAGDKSAFIGTSKNTTRIAGVDFWLSIWLNPDSVSGTQYIIADGGSGATRGVSAFRSGTSLALEISNGTSSLTKTVGSVFAAKT